MNAIIALARRPDLSRRTTSALTLIGLIVLLSFAAASGWVGRGWFADRSAPRAFDGFQLVRLKTVQAQLDQVRGPYIVVMGDSHAERLFLPSLCGLPVVNAGMSGATLGEVLDLARRIAPAHKAEAVLLSVGTNDIWVKRIPETEAAESGFRAGLAALAQRLTASWSSRRALIAIPPVESKEEALFPRSAASRYSAMLAQSCEPEHCSYVDLFAGARDLPARLSPFSDGVHLRDYARFVRDHEAELCKRFGLIPPG